MVDALDSKSSILTGVSVRVRPSAPSLTFFLGPGGGIGRRARFRGE